MSGLRRLIVALALLALAGGTAQAQMHGGNVKGTVTSAQGEVLAGVTLTLTCYGVPLETVSADVGTYSYMNVNAAPCLLTAALEGYTTVVDVAADIKVGLDITVDVVMVPLDDPAA